MDNFTENLKNIIVASTSRSINVTNEFNNILCTEMLDALKKPAIGTKDGSHFLRSELITSDSGKCLPRSTKNMASTSAFLILDCDKRINSNGEALEGAPSPARISEILKNLGINHILYASYSHYSGTKGNRYRIVMITNTPYTKEQLPPTVESAIALINANLEGDQLANATENSTWAQPWYYPRQPANSTADNLYFEYLEGQNIAVVDPVETPPQSEMQRSNAVWKGKISPIDTFNRQNSITDLLKKYGYKKIHVSSENERWITPNSSSGIAGIIVRGDKFFSHHGSCPFNDGYWHDAFDLMRISEGLSESEAVKKAAQDTQTASECHECNDHPHEKPITHNKILNLIFEKIPVVDFRKTVKVNEKEKLKYNHLQIVTIETIMNVARHNDWGLFRNHDFIYIFNGEYWSLLDEDDLKSFLGKSAEKMGVDKFNALHFHFRDQLYKQFLSFAHLPKPEQPEDAVLINLKNGTFQITPNGTQLKPFNRDDLISYQLPFEYNPDSTAPQFQVYLDRVLPDEQLQNILAEFVGYIFIRPSTLKLEKTLLLYGNGANGKSVFYEVLRSLIGTENISEYPLQCLTDEKGYQRAMIANKLLNYASEINGRLEASIFKQLVSGEPVAARLPHGRPFIISDYAKMIFNCNDLPRDVEQTEAYFRRFLIIPFNVTIPEHEQDKELSKKITSSELSGVFNWALKGLNRLLTQKQFTDSHVVRQAREQYEKESDSVKLFLDEGNYIPSIDSFITIKELYRDYRVYCQDNGHHAVSSINFKKRLGNARIETIKKNIGNVAFVSKSNEYSQAKWGA